MSRYALSPIEHTVKQELENNFADLQSLHLVLGLSGGVDSTSLLHILNRLDIELTVVHINYGTRGEASDKDAAFVQHLCDDLNIQCKVYKAEPEEADFSNFQAWARQFRYNKFDKALQATHADGIAIAHHHDDQIETILQKIFRGSGLASWTGMDVWDGRIFRPLLSISRNEIEQYSETKKLSFRLDESNLNSDYARNFLRNDWLPELKEHFPGWQQNIQRVSQQASIFKFALQYILSDLKSSSNGLYREAFMALPPPLQKSLLLYFIKQKAPGTSVSTAALSQLGKVKKLQTGKRLNLTDEISLMNDRDELKIIAESRKTFNPKELQYRGLKEDSAMYGHVEFAVSTFHQPDFTDALYLDAKKLSWPLIVRRWKQGDRIQPLGMTGHQTVADHQTNRKVDADKKNQTIVVQTFQETVAAVIFPASKKEEPPGTISEKFKCSGSTIETLTVKPKI